MVEIGEFCFGFEDRVRWIGWLEGFVLFIFYFRGSWEGGIYLGCWWVFLVGCGVCRVFFGIVGLRTLVFYYLRIGWVFGYLGRFFDNYEFFLDFFLIVFRI